MRYGYYWRPIGPIMADGELVLVCGVVIVVAAFFLIREYWK